MASENTVYVKLKDSSGSFYIASQGKSVNRNQIVEVENDKVIVEATAKGSLVKATKEEFDKYHAERNKAIEALAKPEVKTTTTTTTTTVEEKKPETPTVEKLDEAGAKALIAKAKAKGVVVEKEGKFFHDKSQFESEDELVLELLDNEKLANKFIAATK